MTVQAAGVGTTVAATVLGITAHTSGTSGTSRLGATTAHNRGTGGASLVRDQLALTGVSHLEILVAVALLLVLAGVLLTGLARRHAAPSARV